MRREIKGAFDLCLIGLLHKGLTLKESCMSCNLNRSFWGPMLSGDEILTNDRYKITRDVIKIMNVSVRIAKHCILG